ncbi:MAG: hypothetical protein V5789_04000 [Colwellia sp.]
MISSVSSGMSMPPPPPNTEQNLTTDQQTLISETLSEYDVDNLSEADAQSIIDTFAEADIQPGAALETALSDAGFDAKSIGELANVSTEGNRPPPPPPKQSDDEISSMADYLTELMEEKLTETNSTSLSDTDKASILEQVFEQFDITEGKSIINTSV